MENFFLLSEDEKSVIDSVYGRQNFDVPGYNPYKLEAIKELTAQEKKFFAGKNFMSSHFFVQTLYKVKGTIMPLKFTVCVNRMLAENEDLRANFCNVGTRYVKVIHPAKTFKTEIIFRNLTNVEESELNDEMEKTFIAEMRREVSLEQDPLIRFAVYKTGADEFGVIVTMAQIISKNFDAEKLFISLFDLPAALATKKPAEELPKKNLSFIRSYWSKLFENAPPPAVLPYEKPSSKPYKQRYFSGTIPADITSDLLNFAQSNRLMLMAILQSAWGFLLQLTNQRRDCLFCQILPAENFSLNVMPVRLTIDDGNLTVEELIRRQFRQLLISQPYSISDWTALDELTVQKKLFEHFIAFKEFTADELEYANYPDTPAEPLGKVIFLATWDSQDMKFGCYFRYTNKKLLMSFIYDAEQFMAGGVEKIYELFVLILKQIITDWTSPFADFTDRLTERIQIQLQPETSSPKNDRMRLRDFISQLPILQGRFKGNIGLFEAQSKLFTRYEGDRISGDLLKENFIFVVSGLLSRNLDTGDGWYNTLDIVEKNAFVNPTSLLEKPRYKVSAEVLTPQAEFMAVPRDIFTEIINKNPEIALSLMEYALKQMERWQIVWLQS